MLMMRYQLPRILERGADNTVTADIRESDDNGEQTATVGTYTLIHGSTVLVDAVAVTGLGPPATYTIPAATLPTTLNLDDNYQERWHLTIDSVVETFNRKTTLARFIPRQVITDTDILAGHTQLARQRDRDEADFSRQRDEAWVWVQRELIDRGKRPELVMDESELRQAHIFRTRHELFRDYATNFPDNTKYQERADEYEEKAQTAMDSLVLTYDADEDGLDDEQWRQTTAPILNFNAPPRWG